MPIPTGGAWPPPEHAPAYRSYLDWDAWHVGSPDKLRDVYAGRGYQDQSLPPSMRQRRYPGQAAGGVVGRFSRWLWGAPPPSTATDGRLHVPLPADLASTSARLLFAEPPKLSSVNPDIQHRLDDLVEDGLHQTLLHAADAASTLGDVYLRPVIDQEVSKQAILDVVHADGAIPVIRWGRLLEVTFWSQVARSGHSVYRLLEHHDVVNRAGRITYALHQGDQDSLGRAVPYAELPSTAYLAGLVDAEGSQPTGLDRLDVVRVPNDGPQRTWRTNPSLRFHGRSDFDGNEQLFDRLDDCWTSWMQDLRIARGRIVVPSYMMQSSGAGMGATFDATREVFTEINAAPGSGTTNPITPIQFNIRHVEHQATADAITQVVLRHAGLSAQTLGMQGGDAAVTATEIQARERQSFTTRGARIQAWRPAIAEAIKLLLAVEAAQLGSRVPADRPAVEFGDSVSEAPETTARTLQLLTAAEAVSYDTRVRMVHPEWTDDQVEAEVLRIRDASAISVQNPDTYAGGPAPVTDPTADPSGSPDDTPPVDPANPGAGR
jgi:hypothetical protein